MAGLTQLVVEIQNVHILYGVEDDYLSPSARIQRVYGIEAYSEFFSSKCLYV